MQITELQFYIDNIAKFLDIVYIISTRKTELNIIEKYFDGIKVN